MSADFDLAGYVYGSKLVPSQIYDILKRISYKSNFQFRYDESHWLPYGGTIFIMMTVQDSRNLEVHDLTVSFIAPIPTSAITDEPTFVRWLLEQTIKAETHEAQEFFKLDGKLVDDPHSLDYVRRALGLV